MIIASAFIAMFAGIGFSLGGLFFWENIFGQGRKCFRLQAEFMHEIFSKTVEFLYMMFFCGHMYIYLNIYIYRFFKKMYSTLSSKKDSDLLNIFKIDLRT